MLTREANRVDNDRIRSDAMDKDRASEACNIVDALSRELYWSFNMKCVLSQCSEQFLNELRTFVDECEAIR